MVLYFPSSTFCDAWQQAKPFFIAEPDNPRGVDVRMGVLAALLLFELFIVLFILIFIPIF